MTPISRGFGGRSHDDVDPSRIPPGRYQALHPVVTSVPGAVGGEGIVAG